MTPILRPYQLEAVAATLDGWATSPDPGGLVLATGLGKTVIFSEVARINHRAFNARTCILVHRDELVTQTVDKLNAADPGLLVGIVQGGNTGIYADVVVASVQTLVRRLGKIDPAQFPRIIVDEAHHMVADSYQKCLHHFGAYDGGRTRTLGVTATPARGDRQGLGAALPGGIWYERAIGWGVEQGFLCPAEVRTVALTGLDTDAIKRTSGDLAAGDLGKAMSSIHAGAKIAEAYAHYGTDSHGRLRRAISFAPTIAVAEAWAADYELVGARAVVIKGSTPVAERRAAYRDVAAGRKDVLSSVMVLTEGFDLPAVEVAIIGRPTKSMPLLTQMVGRVLRPSPGKTSALLLDVVGSLGGGLARSYDLSIPEPKEDEAPPQDEDTMPRERRERIEVRPPEKLDWVARDLFGEPIKKGARRKTHSEPGWLRTYGGVSFLPASPPEVPWRLFCWLQDGLDNPWWRLERGGQPEPVTMAPGADPRDLHPGWPLAWDDLFATDPQAQLLTKLGLMPEGNRPTKRRASELIEIHFASREIDAVCRPKLAVVPPPHV